MTVHDFKTGLIKCIFSAISWMHLYNKAVLLDSYASAWVVGGWYRPNFSLKAERKEEALSYKQNIHT